MSMIREIVNVALWQGRDPFLNFEASPHEMAQSATADAFLEFAPFVAATVITQLPEVVIDVGAGDGTTTVQIARLFRERRHNGVVIAVDTWLGTWEHWCKRSGLNQLRPGPGQPTLQSAFMGQVQSQGVQHYVVPLPLDDSNASILLKRKRLAADLLYLNPCPTGMSVETSLKLWWPLLRGGGRLFANTRRRNHHSSLQARQIAELFAREHAAVCESAGTLTRIDKPATISLTSHRQEHVLARSSDVAHALEYEGEFSAELVLFLPYVTWLSAAGLLRNTRIVTYAGMRCFYDHLQCGEFVEKHSLRRHVVEERRLASLPVKSEMTYEGGPSPFHLYPDLRGKFMRVAMADAFDGLPKPLLIVHNKFAIEWNRQPINHFGLELLDRLFQLLTHEFTVVYIRHGMTPEPQGYSKDDNFSLPFDDRAVLNAHPEIICFDDVYADYTRNGGTQDVNTFKNVLYSRCYHFISSQGGGASHMAFFSGSLLMVLHRYGREERLAYGNGFYGFLANPAPIRIICLNDDELLRGIQLFRCSSVMDGRAMVGGSLKPLLDELSPWTLEKRRSGKWSR